MEGDSKYEDKLFWDNLITIKNILPLIIGNEHDVAISQHEAKFPGLKNRKVPLVDSGAR